LKGEREMSWDVFSDREHECPCGKGTYREIIEMDDWNRTREDVTMNCPDCRIKYKMKYYQSSDGGEYWRWALKEEGK
jgi:hypothetical protein